MTKPIILVAAFAAVLLAGCQSTPTDQAAAPVEDRAATSAGAGSGASTSGA
ncbi:MAG: peptidoglycan-associated lipoprotein, partial [Betaproteobacteria bacterium PRO3]|nr:peptidoglycan-associated lipoprotein [Betaproteobacteria bacterium PRO3]